MVSNVETQVFVFITFLEYSSWLVEIAIVQRVHNELHLRRDNVQSIAL